MPEFINSNDALAVGDIHGRLDLLKKLIREVLPLYPDYTPLAFLGDYIDRGPDSRQVLDLLIDLRNARPNVTCLEGNHEDMLLQAWMQETSPDLMEDPQNPGLGLFLLNGGIATLRSYGLQTHSIHKFPAEHIRFINSLPHIHETDSYVFVHAGLKPGAPSSKRDHLWIRHDFIDSDFPFPKPVIFGHTRFDEPFVRGNLIGIDTGAAYGGSLTCVKLPEMIFHQVTA